MQRRKLIPILILIAVLTAAFFWDGNAQKGVPTTATPSVTAVMTAQPTASIQPTLTPAPTMTAAPQESVLPSPQPTEAVAPIQTESEAPVQTESEAPLPTATPEASAKSENAELTCNLSVRCDTLLHNMARLKSGKAACVPSDGNVFTDTALPFEAGESVFDVLLRTMHTNNIPFEFSKTTGSAYIEGIGNLYERDCGALSGWMYKVNGEFQNCSCSDYVLQQGDTVEWVYTCDLGADVGNRS